MFKNGPCGDKAMTVAYGFGEMVGLLCGVALASVVLTYIIGKSSGAFGWGTFGYALLAISVVVLLITLSGRRKHAEPIA